MVMVFDGIFFEVFGVKVNLIEDYFSGDLGDWWRLLMGCVLVLIDMNFFDGLILGFGDICMLSFKFLFIIIFFEFDVVDNMELVEVFDCIEVLKDNLNF